MKLGLTEERPYMEQIIDYILDTPLSKEKLEHVTFWEQCDIIEPDDYSQPMFTVEDPIKWHEYFKYNVSVESILNMFYQGTPFKNWAGRECTAASDLVEYRGVKYREVNNMFFCSLTYMAEIQDTVYTFWY